MNICLNSPFIIQGENKSRTLTLNIEPSEIENKKVKLMFITPLGKFYITDELNPLQNGFIYTLPHSLLDRYGTLRAQIVVYDENGYCKKSKVFDFDVAFGMEKESETVPNGKLINMAVLSEKLSEVEEAIFTCSDNLGVLSNTVSEHTQSIAQAQSKITEITSDFGIAQNDIERLLIAVADIDEIVRTRIVALTQAQLNEIFV